MTNPLTDVIGLRVEGTALEHDLCGQVGYVIGSGPGADICIRDDEYVSRLHCALVRERDGQLLVVDRESHNGTFVNGVRCHKAYVTDGDTLRVGDTALVAYSASSRGSMSRREARLAMGRAIGSLRAQDGTAGAARELGVSPTVVEALATKGTKR